MPYKLVPTKLFLSKLKKLDKSIVTELEKKLERLKQNPVSSEHRMHHSHDYYRFYLRGFSVLGQETRWV